MRRVAWGAPILFLGLAAAGCSGGPKNQAPTQDDMKLTALNDVGELYRVYSASAKKPPTKVEDFAKFEMMSPTGLRALKSGAVVVFYKAELPDLAEGPGQGPSDIVLAYEKPVPESGGKVLMLNRTVKALTAAEFQAAKKAGDGAAASAPKDAKAK